MFSFYVVLLYFTFCLYMFCFLFLGLAIFKGDDKQTKFLKKPCPSITIAVIQVLEISKSMSKSSICLAFWYTCRLHFVFSLILFIYLTSWEENMTILLYSVVVHPSILFITLLLWIILVLGRRVNAEHQQLWYPSFKHVGGVTSKKGAYKRTPLL